MKLSSVLAVLPFALAGPVEKRQQFCDQWGLIETGAYTLYNNLWGRDAADSGEQCTTLISSSGNRISWSAAWTWIGDRFSVKSYPNAVYTTESVPLSSISSIPTSWSWSYTGSGIIANVAYDIFTASTADGAPEYEIMIWLGSLGGAGPISSTGSTIATPNIGGVSWNLYTGSHSQMTVFSFVAPSNIGSFSGDLTDFTDYLRANQGLSGDQIVQTIGAGTEPFIGENAVFTTESYSVSVA